MFLRDFIKRCRAWVNLSINRRLILWSTGFLVVAIVIFSVTLLWFGQTRMIKDAAQRNTRLASVISRDVNLRISSIYVEAHNFAGHLENIPSDLPTQAGAVLSLRLAATQRYPAIYYLDAQGVSLFQVNESLPELSSFTSGDQITSQNQPTLPDGVVNAFAREKNGNDVSDINFIGTQQSPVIFIAQQIKVLSGDTRAIVFEVDLSDIWKTLDSLTFGNTGFAYAVSRNGIVISHPDPHYIGRQISPSLQPLLTGSEGYIEYKEPYRGVSVLSAYSPGPLGWGIVVQQDRSEAYAAINQTGFLSIGILFLFAIAGIIGILIMVRNFTRPIVKLTDTAFRIAETGDLTSAPTVESPDEVGRMGHAFNHMIERIRQSENGIIQAHNELEHRVEERTSDLRSANTALQNEIVRRTEIEEKLRQSELKHRALVENSNSIILEIDTDGRVVYFNPFAQQFFGFKEEEIIGRNVIGTIVPEIDSSGRDLKALIADLTRNPDKYNNSENENIRSNGDRVWVAWTNKGQYNKENALVGILCTGIDRTEAQRAATTLEEKARSEAAQAERIRLARDLHDAVSQTLFSASLIAEVIPRLWDKNKEEAKKRLEEVRQLTRGALAEMRTLLFELRPAALADAELSDLMRHLTESVTGRSRVQVSLEVDGSCPLPSDVKIALYRIAQEALNNVGKHSGASDAKVTLKCEPHNVVLHIVDNGRGFDTSSVMSGSFGLSNMKERAAGIGASLDIESKIDNGTEVIAIWHDRNEEENNDTIKSN